MTEFLMDICNTLEIEEPKIVVDYRKLNGTLARYDPQNKVIYIYKNDFVNNVDLSFCIMREMRRIQQESNNLNELDSYIDSNAFACAMAGSFYGIVPKYHNINKDIVKQIYIKAQELEKEYRAKFYS